MLKCSGLSQESLAKAQDDTAQARAWNDVQVTVNMDKLAEARENVEANAREAAAAIADGSRVIERLKAELKALGERAESSAYDALSSRRRAAVCETTNRDLLVQLEVRKTIDTLG